MISFEACPAQWRVGILVIWMISVWLLLFLCIFEIFLRKRRLWTVIDAFLLVGNILMNGVYRSRHNMLCDRIRVSPSEVPVWLTVAVGLSGSVYALLRLIMIRRHHNESLTKYAIQESLDNLPSGIGFFDRYGIPKMINHQMHQLTHFLRGSDVQSAEELREALKAPAEKVRILDAANGLYRFPDGRVWQFSEVDMPAQEGMNFTQFLATDVSKLYESRKKLEEENSLLLETANSMKELSRNMLAVTREEETLALKMRVHDDLGHSVLRTQRFLSNKSTEEEGKALLAQWRRVLGLLEHDNEAMAADERMNTLHDRAASLGLELSFEGNFPTDDGNGTLIMMAAQECMTNCVRHAQATRLVVTIREEESTRHFIFTNNGKPPVGKIVEGGGLSGLRQQVEGRGGRMEVCSCPEFSLSITIPKKERS